ncbi:MAG: carbohydrate kinase [Ardenticatenaceae bacterium]|nr:carbohydrate kinase [Ardenticatenaceae bacterium]MCB9445849.1 carbohydrate kinase [Ardenticatenaceae bacterium]
MILCCGEALIDFVPLPGQRAYQPCPGGSVYNIAVGLGRLEAPVGFFCKIATDYFGDMLVDYLVENGVNTTYCLRQNSPTTLAFVSLPDGDEPRYMFYANDTADRLLAESELPDLPEAIQALHFGSISLVMEPGAAALTALMARESGRRIISLDPNVRPGLIADRVAYRQKFESWVQLVDIVRLSQVDFDFLYPGVEPEQMIGRWLEMGVSLCILTLGEKGAVGYTALGETAVTSPPAITIADTVGAGDTFLAAVLAYLHQTSKLQHKEQLRSLKVDELQHCLDYASRAAAINCSRPGANPPYKHEMEQTYE